MPPRNNSDSQAPTPTVTRPRRSNANTHPGNAVLALKQVRRPADVVAQEKAAKLAKAEELIRQKGAARKRIVAAAEEQAEREIADEQLAVLAARPRSSHKDVRIGSQVTSSTAPAQLATIRQPPTSSTASQKRKLVTSEVSTSQT